MKSVLIIGEQRKSVDKIKQSLPDECSVLIANSDDEALELILNISVDLVLIDAPVLNDAVLKTVTKLKSYRPNCVVLCTLDPEGPDAVGSDLASEKHQLFDFFIRKPILPTEVRKIIQNALEKQELLQELADLRSEAPKRAHTYAATDMASQPSAAASNLTHILTAMAKALSTSFDLDKLMTLFLDIVAEMLRLSRASLMVYDPISGEYQIRAYRGLLPQLASSIKLKGEDALPIWFIREGRLITKAEAESIRTLPSFRQLYTELEKLQAVASIPLLAQGNLVGILNIGPRITGLPYTTLELETLFILANHVAVSIQDIRLYHQIQYHRACIENILAYMGSGVISINTDEKVVIYNHRAAEILGIPRDEVLNKDLRSLPSPLGDMLFETYKDGKTYDKEEVSLALRQISLEVNSYPIEDADGGISGSVMVFEDLSQQKQLEQERKHAIAMDLFNRIMTAMAHEIKDPLVSIRTFVELLPSQFENSEFRERFYTTVQHDVERLDGLVEKIISLADPASRNLDLENIEALLKEWVRLLKEEGTDQWIKIALKSQAQIPSIQYDEAWLTRAFLYLMRYLVRSVDLPAKVEIKAKRLKPSEAKEKQIEIRIRCTYNECPDEPLAPLLRPSSESTGIEDLKLPVSQKIIADSGGRLEAKRSPDGKLVFIVQIDL